MSSTHRAQHTTSQDDHVKATLNDYIMLLEITQDCEHCRTKFAELRK